MIIGEQVSFNSHFYVGIAVSGDNQLSTLTCHGFSLFFNKIQFPIAYNFEQSPSGTVNRDFTESAFNSAESASLHGRKFSLVNSKSGKALSAVGSGVRVHSQFQEIDIGNPTGTGSSLDTNGEIEVKGSGSGEYTMWLPCLLPHSSDNIFIAPNL